MLLTTEKLIETLNSYKTWAYIEDHFGRGPDQGTGKRVEEHLLNLLNKAEQYEAYNVLYDHIDSTDEFRLSGFLDALDYTLDVLEK